MTNEVQFQPEKSAFAIVGLLRACTAHKDLAKGSKLHAYIREHTSLERNLYISGTLVNMYAKCGALAKAHRVLEGLPVRDVITWSALIAGYAQQGKGEEALKCFDSMQREGHSPDAVTFSCALKACGSIGAAAKGKEIHDKIVSLGMLGNDTVLGSSLIDMYVRCSSLAKAQQVLQGLPVRDVIMWNTLMTGYVQQGQGEEALKCYDSMQYEEYSPDVVTFICALKACGVVRAVAKGKQIHDKIVSLAILEKNIELGNALVDMYARCGALAKAQQVLEGLPVRDVVTWSTLIAGYTQQGQGEEALKCFDSMQREGHSPNAVTFICALKACGSIKAATKGEQIHDMIVALGVLEKDRALGNTLVDMYAKCGALAKAQQVLEGLCVRDVVIWSALIAGYAHQGQGEEALKCFDGLQREGHSPDVVTFTSALKACGSIGAITKGEEIHNMVVSSGMLEKDIVLGNALVDMYARCGALAKAHRVLEGLQVQNVVMWNAVIAGYTQQGQGEEALKCYDSMQHGGHSPDVVTYICALKACGTIGAAVKGEEIHNKILNLDMLEKNIELWNSLMDMYAKCATLTKALEVFKKLPFQIATNWNALIGGYAMQGQTLEAFNCFEKMQSEGVKPDSITLICVLNACSHSGLLDLAEMLFSRMSIEYGITPDVEHFCCMVDLFMRARMSNKGIMVIEKMPSAEYFPVWIALLGACREWGDVKIGRLAFERALHLDNSDAAVYVCMANIYIAAGMQEDAEKIEEMRVVTKAWNMPGCCWWTDPAGIVHSFTGDKKHAQSRRIYTKPKDLTGRMSWEGCFQTILDKTLLCGHSEKQAIAYALINTPPGTSIFVAKNMRVCVECHRAIAAVSEMENREIKVRDVDCLHIFSNGKCFCEEY